MKCPKIELTLVESASPKELDGKGDGICSSLF